MPSEDWLAAFPHEDARIVVRALCEIWNELAEASSRTFHAGAQEPLLTEILCEYIRAVFKERTRLTGQWSYERRFGQISGKASGAAKIINRRRTDIEYFSDKHPVPLELVFEFKKISQTRSRRRAYIGENGLMRFVTGKYSAKQPIAVMVGILLKPAADCVPALITLLGTAQAREMLRMPAAPASPVCIPSALFPPDAHFDTEHARESELAPPHGKIAVAHVFLGFPTANAHPPEVA